MPVERIKKNKRSDRVSGCVLVCEKCGERSKTYPAPSPAAPELSACELAEKDGWAYDIGFFSMLLGHQTLCPKCARGA
jgi:hypothetical protein